MLKNTICLQKPVLLYCVRIIWTKYFLTLVICVRTTTIRSINLQLFLNTWSSPWEANAQAEKQIDAVVHSCQERSKYLQFDNNDNKNIPFLTAPPDMIAQLLIVANICNGRGITLVRMPSILYRWSEVPLNVFTITDDARLFSSWWRFCFYGCRD